LTGWILPQIDLARNNETPEQLSAITTSKIQFGTLRDLHANQHDFMQVPLHPEPR
jgi:hypothetical protein